eukprot:scaffold820_cov227-Pinguiococcus_pyrenoidosus.AAC.8
MDENFSSSDFDGSTVGKTYTLKTVSRQFKASGHHPEFRLSQFGPRGEVQSLEFTLSRCSTGTYAKLRSIRTGAISAFFAPKTSLAWMILAPLWALAAILPLRSFPASSQRPEPLLALSEDVKQLESIQLRSALGRGEIVPVRRERRKPLEDDAKYYWRALVLEDQLWQERRCDAQWRARKCREAADPLLRRGAQEQLNKLQQRVESLTSALEASERRRTDLAKELERQQIFAEALQQQLQEKDNALRQEIRRVLPNPYDCGNLSTLCIGTATAIELGKDRELQDLNETIMASEGKDLRSRKKRVVEHGGRAWSSSACGLTEASAIPRPKHPGSSAASERLVWDADGQERAGEDPQHPVCLQHLLPMLRSARLSLLIEGASTRRPSRAPSPERTGPAPLSFLPRPQVQDAILFSCRTPNRSCNDPSATTATRLKRS